MTNLRAPNGATTDMVETCDRPIRDRSGEELPGVRCNLPAGHLGKHAQIWQAWGADTFGRPGTVAAVDGESAAVTPSDEGPHGPA